VNDKENYAKMFFNAIQNSLNSTGKYACELKADYSGERIRIITNGAGDEKLAVLFDIILNSEEYYSHVKEMLWIVNNSPHELPKALRVTVSENVQSRVILVGNSGKRLVEDNDGKFTKEAVWSTSKFKGIECNGRLLNSLYKKYSTNHGILVTECPQFSEVDDETWSKFQPANCYSLYSGGGGTATPSGVVPSQTPQGLRIKDFNITGAIEYIKSHVVQPTGHSQCASHVEDAIAYGGALKPRMSCNETGKGSAATNLHYYGILEAHGWY
jgi:hypothetical protein